ncbi:MAG: serine/threonine-protein kinase, partial [Myxococcota bacterium]
MAKPPRQSDPFADATTQARGRRKDRPAEKPAGRGAQPAAEPSSSAAPSTDEDDALHSGRQGDPFEATLIREQTRPLEYITIEMTGVTPEVSDRYREHGKELGRGGIGRVVSAFDSHLQREVAIKELHHRAYPKGSNDTASDLARFLREARITGQLEHPSIVPVYELGQREDGRLYYAMKLVRGRTLRQALDAAKDLKERMALLRHFVDVAHAIAYAHNRGVVHRDIKPENVMLGEFGETVVLDWGLAKLKDQTDEQPAPSSSSSRQINGSDAPNTLHGEVVGTPAYMSPEQAAGLIHTIDERTDVWSLGAVLFEILTGTPPFTGATVENVIRQVITADLEPIRAAEGNAPADLSAIAEKALSKDLSKRYPSASALVEDVIAFQNGRQVAAYDYTAWDLIKKFAREYRVAAIASVLITVTALLGGVATFAAYRQAVAESIRAHDAENDANAARLDAETKERQAHSNLSVALAEKARLLTSNLDFGAAGVFAAASLHHNPFVDSSPYKHPDLDRRAPGTVAAAQLGPRSALFEIFVRRQLALTASLATAGANACAFAIFNDGRHLLSTDASGRFVLWDLERQTPQATLSGPHCPRYVEVDVTGETALILNRDRSAQLMDLRSGRLRAVVASEGTLRAVKFGPRGDSIYVLGATKSVQHLDKTTFQVLAQTTVTAPRAAALDPNFERLAIGTRWGQVEILDATTLKKQYRFKDHNSTIWSVAFDSEGARLVAAGYEGHAVVRNLVDDRAATVLPGSSPVDQVTFTPDGRHVVGVGFERGRLWHIDEQTVLQTFRIYRRGLQHVGFRPNTNQVLTAGFWSERSNLAVRRSPAGHPISWP